MSKKSTVILWAFVALVVAGVAVFVATMIAPRPKERLVMVFPPGESAELAVLKERFGPVCDALGVALDMDCVLVLSTSYPATMEALRNGTADVGRVGATQYVLTRDEIRLRLVAWEIVKGAYHYHSVLMGRPGIWKEPFTMDQLKGKSVAFVDPSSTSGYVAPLTMMIDAGLTLDDLGSYYFATSHPAAIEALLNGRVDVATTGNTLTDELVANGKAVEGEDFVILVESPPLVMDTWVVGPSVPQEKSDRIAAALLNLPPEAFEGSYIDGFWPVDEQAYEFNVKMLKTIGELK